MHDDEAIFVEYGQPLDQHGTIDREINASDSTALLEQMAILRTIRFLNDR
jgi:hypothetical protein